MFLKLFFYFVVSYNANAACNETRTVNGQEIRTGDVIQQASIQLTDDFYEEHDSIERYLHLRCREIGCMRAADWGTTPASNNRPSMDIIYPDFLTSFTCTNSRLPRVTMPLTRAARLKNSYQTLTRSGVLGAFIPADQRSEVERRGQAVRGGQADEESLD
jgi:hypothetical protein